MSSPFATVQSWKRQPMPAQRQRLDFQACFTPAQARVLRQGLTPQDMDDRWCIDFAGGWLRFHRSWTGVCIYALRLQDSPQATAVAEAWVNRDPAQYRGLDSAAECDTLRALVHRLLLRQPPA